MEGIGIGILLGLMFLYFTRDNTSSFSSSADSKSSIHKPDDKNWIVNNKFVSFDEDSPTLIFQQEMEDLKVWHEFESYARDYHYKRLDGIFWGTLEAKSKNLPEFKINNRRLVLIESEHEKYLKECKTFDVSLTLKKEDYAYYKFDKFAHWYIPMNFWCPPFRIYYIHNRKTDKYRGDSSAKLQLEFNTKYFG